MLNVWGVHGAHACGLSVRDRRPDCTRTVMEGRVVEVKSRRDVLLLKRLIAKYHSQGVPPGGGAGRHPRFFVYAVEDGGTEFWVAAAWLHDGTPFRFLAQRLMIPVENAYFIRRICRLAPGDWLIPFLNALAERLSAEGKEALWSLGLPGHSNAVYKRAGFVEVGRTTRSGVPVFVRWLRR